MINKVKYELYFISLKEPSLNTFSTHWHSKYNIRWIFVIRCRLLWQTNNPPLWFRFLLNFWWFVDNRLLNNRLGLCSCWGEVWLYTGGEIIVENWRIRIGLGCGVFTKELVDCFLGNIVRNSTGARAYCWTTTKSTKWILILIMYINWNYTCILQYLKLPISGIFLGINIK